MPVKTGSNKCPFFHYMLLIYYIYPLVLKLKFCILPIFIKESDMEGTNDIMSNYMQHHRNEGNSLNLKVKSIILNLRDYFSKIPLKQSDLEKCREGYIWYYKIINEDHPRINDEHKYEVDGFGTFPEFINYVALPEEMKKGEEYFSFSTPIIQIQRKRGVGNELIKNRFWLTTKIRIHFHWNGIEILGSNMDSPNTFTLPVPKDKLPRNWYFKVGCQKETSSGLKRLYVSFDTIHENIFLKWFLLLVKYIGLCAILSILIMSLFFRNSELFNMFLFKDNLGDNLTPLKNASTFLILLLFIIAFWKKLSESLESIYMKEEKSINRENRNQDGGKFASDQYGIKVK